MGNNTGPARCILVGAGSRGSTYASWIANHPEQATLVAVAEPRPAARQAIASSHGIGSGRQFESWQDLLETGSLADVAIVAVQDGEHRPVATALAAQGYHLLLEKPIAPTLDACREVVSACHEADVALAVCHVLRHTPVTKTIKGLIEAGRIGQVMTVDLFEPVGFWHQAHSFVRGNWRRQDRSSPMLLAKSCHDLDWLRYVVDRPVVSVSSFGSLRHFVPAQRPPGAADRCVDCSAEPSCAYSAKRIYGRFLAAGHHGWPLDVVTPHADPESLEAALRDGPYGRCVFTVDNDVVDHQVVCLEFTGGVTATFTMSGFTRHAGRESRICGTEGELFTDSKRIELYDFLTDRCQEVPVQGGDGTGSGHGGGDGGLLEWFFSAVNRGDYGVLRASGDEALRSHELVFAAEQARRDRQVVSLSD